MDKERGYTIMSHAKKFLSDPRISEAKKLIAEALKEHRQGIIDIADGDPSCRQDYEDSLAVISQKRGQKPLFPYIASGIGNGALVELDDGSVKYDFIGNIGVYGWGHSDEDLVLAAVDAALTDVAIQGHLQPGKEYLSFLKVITKVSGFDHCVLTTSGALACENALKLAFAKKTSTSRVLAFEKCFMGRTLATTQISDIGSCKDILPNTLDVDYIPFYNHNDPEKSTNDAINAIEGHIAANPGAYAALCVELVQGNGGIYPGTHDFFSAVMAIAKKHDIAVVIDEVQTFGRTPQIFAFQHFGLEEYADIVTFGKFSQVCGTLFNEYYRPPPRLIRQTLPSSATALAVGKVIIEKLVSGDFLGEDGKISLYHKHFVKNLEVLSERYPGTISGPYGLGGMVAFTYRAGDKEATTSFVEKLYDAGVIAFTAGGTPKRVRFLLPVGVITVEDIDAVVEIIEKTLIIDN